MQPLLEKKKSQYGFEKLKDKVKRLQILIRDMETRCDFTKKDYKRNYECRYIAMKEERFVDDLRNRQMERWIKWNNKFSGHRGPATY